MYLYFLNEYGYRGSIFEEYERISYTQKKIFGMEYLRCPQNYLWVAIFGFLFSSLLSFAKMNIYHKHGSNILLSKRECRPSHLLWPKYSPDPFQSQHFLRRSPGPERLQGAGWVSECGLSSMGLFDLLPRSAAERRPGSLSSCSRAAGQCSLAECWFIL